MFRPIHYKPYYSAQKDVYQHGIQTYITDADKAPLTLIQFYVLQECYKMYPDKNVFELCTPSRLNMFDKVCGTSRIRETFTKTFSVASIQGIWNEGVDDFRKKAKQYFLYK
jgi:uncharacterized protein YbbC (DUF1343 family)